MPEKISLTQQLIEIGAAAGETAGILDIPYLRTAHQRRQRILEAVGSAAIDGRSTTPERLFAWLADIPIQAQPNLGAEGYAAELFRVLAESQPSGGLAAEAYDLAAAARSRAARDPLAGAAVLFRGRDMVTPASRAAYSLFLRHALGPCEPALSPILFGLEAAAKRPAAVFDAFIADRLAKAARRALANARTLRTGIETLYHVLGRARATSHVHGIAELLFAGHPLSFASAAKIFRISRLAARNHLIRLEGDGLAELATRRKTGLIYIARDGLMTFARTGPSPAPKATTRLSVTTGRPLSADERAHLNAVSDDVAGRMADLDRTLARLKAAYPG